MTAYFLKGGPIMWPIFICSIAAGAISLILGFRLWQLRRLKIPVKELKQSVSHKDWAGAFQICEQGEHPFLKPWCTGFQLLAEGKSDLRDIEELVSVEGAKTVGYFEMKLNMLSALTTVLPMLGFLGTIFGLIMSFENWEQMGAQVSISALSGGIYQAMITTAAGLMAAIPYHFLHHYFANCTHQEALRLSRETTDLFRQIKETLLREIVSDQDLALSQTPASP